ncbi:MAG: NAD(P)-dependent oxidoreductase [Magnetococcus sp. MYC-9]
MKIGITGGRGVLGRRIADALAQRQHQIVPLPGDVRDRDTVFQWATGLDALVHAAAVTPVSVVRQDIPQAVATNVFGTSLVATAAGLTRTGHITYISSSHVYRGSPTPIAEDHQLAPTSPYGLSKWQGEQWVQAITDNYLIIRMFSYFSSNQQEGFLVPALAKRISDAPEHAVLELHNPSAVRDIADADWMATVCAQLIHNQETGVVNCGTGRGTTVRDIADTLLARLGRTECSWRWVTNHADRLVADTTLLQRKLTTLPPFSLEEALTRFVKEFGTP